MARAHPDPWRRAFDSRYSFRMHRSASPAEPHDRHLLLDDPDVARGVFEGLYQVPRVDIHRSSERRFVWNWQISSRGTSTIIRGHARTGGVSVGGHLTHYVLVLASEGLIDVSCNNGRFDVTPGRTAGILSAGTEAEALARNGTRTLNIRIDPGALTSHAAALLGAPVQTAPRFGAHIDLTAPGGSAVLRLARLLEEASATPESPLGAAHVLAHIQEALYGALLLGQDSTIHHLLRKPPPAADTRAVRRAEEILAARAAEPISITEVAALTGIGLRSLERSFKAARGCSLRDFLKAQRLELAHRRLRAAPPGTTVTQILHASGFSHPGEFSLAYRKRFGEAPSETLRRSAGGALSEIG